MKTSEKRSNWMIRNFPVSIKNMLAGKAKEAGVTIPEYLEMVILKHLRQLSGLEK